jgi:ankyrin repeat protein
VRQQLQAMNKNNFDAIRRKYSGHPEFLGIEIVDANQPGAMDDTLLHIAARTGQLNDVIDLLACGADVNRAGDMGFTPLHQAAMKGRVEVIEVLLKAGARREIKNDWDQSAADVAEIGGHSDVVALLGRKRG